MKEVNITVDMTIGDKIVAKSNEYYERNRNFPTVLTLGNEQYRDLWLMTYYTWTREISKPHVLTRYGNCEIKIDYENEIICS